MATAREIPDFDTMVQNIIAMYYSGTPTQLVHGTRWYTVANGDAGTVQSLVPSGISIVQASDVISVLCPQKSWPENVRDAVAVATAYGLHGDVSRGLVNQHMGTSETTGKSIGIFCTDIQLGECLSILTSGVRVTGIKRRDFADCIAYPEDTLDTVVVDQHALRIAIDSPEDNGRVPTDRIYRLVASAYRASAEILGIHPQHLQAITWLVWRSIPRRANGRQHHVVRSENVTRGYVPE